MISYVNVYVWYQYLMVLIGQQNIFILIIKNNSHNQLILSKAIINVINVILSRRDYYI